MNNPLPDSSELLGVLFAAPYFCKDSDLSRNGRESLAKAPWRGGNSLAVELPEVEFGGAWQCHGGRNQSE